MTDVTLCRSDVCPVRERCRRNVVACPTAYKPDSYFQAYARWEPKRGESCGGFEPVGVPAK